MEAFENFFTLFTKFEYSGLINIFDITFILIVSISIFYALRKGLINSFLNLIKWILIVLAIKFGAPIIHPIFLNFSFFVHSNSFIYFNFFYKQNINWRYSTQEIIFYRYLSWRVIWFIKRIHYRCFTIWPK